MCKKFLCLFLWIFFYINLFGQKYEEKNTEGEDIFFNFENPSEIWKITPIKDNAVKNISISSEKFLDGGNSLKMDIQLPGEGCIEKEFYKDLSIYKTITFNIYFPEDIPSDLKICFFVQDYEWLWYQTPLFSISKGKWNKISINVEPTSTFWENIGHSQPWSEKTISSIRKIGFKIFSNTKYTGSVYIDEIKGNYKTFPEFSINKKKLIQFEKFEIYFFLSKKYQNPFDPDEIKITGVFIDPDGIIFEIPGFYYQEYERKLENNEEILYPVGYPYWKIRFTPEKEGLYKFYIKINDKDGEVKSEIGSFTVEKSMQNKNPFIKVNEIDSRFFSYKNGDFFYPVGINIRSPTDERYEAMMGRKRKIQDIPDAGTFYYEKMFKKMNENGMNFIEIWLCPWFAALEWKENRPGFKGIGYYNLRNAWKIDKILEFAEKYNIYIQLVIINHGQLSTWCDQEWQDNPYNVKNGGFLKSPNEFFTDERAKKYFKNLLRYIVGRWGYSPYIFSWEILNEINLVGDKRNYFREREKDIENWYREMADYLRNIDPFKHMITAHYTILVNNKILSDIVDYTITNGYYNYQKESLPLFLRFIYNFNSIFKKPTFVSEYGGTPGGSSVENLKRDIILGLWYSFHLPFAGIPLFWWHRFIDEFNLFKIYRNFSEYIKGIYKMKPNMEKEDMKIEGPGKSQIYYIGIGNKFFSSCLLYDYSTTKEMQRTDFPEFKDIVVFLKNKKKGEFKVEFFDLEEGEINETQIITDENGELKIPVPSFKKWIAVKVSFYGEREKSF